MPDFENETASFWLTMSKEDLANVAAAAHHDRRVLAEGEGYREVMSYRAAIAAAFLQGTGVEVGAGNRPWPIPPRTNCFYGDSRDAEKLTEYFKADEAKHKNKFDGFLDAQTFAGVADSSLDFVISAHVIEHLADPIGAMRETIRILRPHGIFLLAVPDMRFTFDCNRPVTTLEHLLADEIDGGKGTRRQAYEDHVRYVHSYFKGSVPENEIASYVDRVEAANMDIHWHAWTGETFRGMLDAVATRLGFQTLAHVPVQNENIFVLRKHQVSL